MPIPLAIPLAMGAAGSIAKLFGGAKAGQAAGIIDEQIQDLSTWYDTETNRDFLQGNIAKGVLENVTKQIQEQNKAVESSAAITGATEASKTAQKEASQKMYGDVVKDLASYGEAQKERVGSEYRANLARLLGQKAGLMRESAANVSQAGGQLMSAGAELFGYGVGGGGGIGQPGIPRSYSPELKGLETRSITDILG